jgi:hypothetical protein
MRLLVTVYPFLFFNNFHTNPSTDLGRHLDALLDLQTLARMNDVDDGARSDGLQVLQEGTRVAPICVRTESEFHGKTDYRIRLKLLVRTRMYTKYIHCVKSIYMLCVDAL